jgi:hypothetical protein
MECFGTLSMTSSFKERLIKITAYSWGFDSRKTYISLINSLLDGEHKEQSVQQSGKQQPNQQHQQQPSDKATHSHSE